MCARFARTSGNDALIKALQIALPDLDIASFPPILRSFNAAPSQGVLAVGRSAPDRPHKFALLTWGFVPSFAKELKGPAPINARCETVAENPMFRTAFERQRCLILADGFYEWKREGKRRIPYYFCLKSGAPFAFAGLYSHCKIEGRALSTCALLTTRANELVQVAHERMPVILEPGDWAAWCDPERRGAEVAHLMRPLPAELLKGFRVSERVNKAGNDDEMLLEPVDAP